MSHFNATIGSAGYGRLMVLGDIGLAVDRGDMLVVLGSNGAGKSTTLKAILGLVNSRERRVQLDGEDLTSLPTWRLPAAGVVLVPDGARTFPNLSIIDNLRGAHLAGQGRRTLPAERELLDQVFAYFPVLRDRQPAVSGTLSGGQRQMLAIGRALMTAPRALLLDEPSAGLAPKVIEELFDSLAIIKRESGCAIVMAEQNVGYATMIADQCIVLEEGRVALSGPMAEVVRSERLRTAYLGV